MESYLFYQEALICKIVWPHSMTRRRWNSSKRSSSAINRGEDRYSMLGTSLRSLGQVSRDSLKNTLEAIKITFVIKERTSYKCQFNVHGMGVGKGRRGPWRTKDYNYDQFRNKFFQMDFVSFLVLSWPLIITSSEDRRGEFL